MPDQGELVRIIVQGGSLTESKNVPNQAMVAIEKYRRGVNEGVKNLLLL